MVQWYRTNLYALSSMKNRQIEEGVMYLEMLIDFGSGLVEDPLVGHGTSSQ